MYDLREIITHIPPAMLSYQEWINVGMALKHEGLPCAIWDRWSMDDSRYRSGICEKKWDTFNGNTDPVTGGTIIEMAKAFGYKPAENVGLLDWEDEISADIIDTAWVEPEEIELNDNYEEKAINDLIAYLDTLFKPGDKVGIVAESFKDKDGKYRPGGRGTSSRTASQIIDEINKCLGKGIYQYDEIIGRIGLDYDRSAGAWVRFNPLDGNGVKNENITEYRYALVESDSIDTEKQFGIIKEMALPVAALVHSGGKSLHAIVKINAPTLEIYKERVEKLYKVCDSYGLKVDRQNKNPSRLSRLPGIRRGKNWQRLLGINIGSSSYAEWEDHISEVMDNLDDPEDLFSEESSHIQLRPEIISGLLRSGRKMIVTGASKAGKSFLLVELAMALATGTSWIGFKCAECKVLYINFEIPRDSFIDRLRAVASARNTPMKYYSGKLDCLSLRGRAKPFQELLPSIKHKAKKGGYSAIIIDPIYKTLLGDENDTKAVGEFCNALDNLSAETGATVIFCHHHSKGADGSMSAQNRSSGSGIFSRDPDAILDLLEIFPFDSDGSPLEYHLEGFSGEESDNTVFMRVESTLREFAPVKPFEVAFSYPSHYTVKGLQNAKDIGQMKTRRQKQDAGRETQQRRKENNINRLLQFIEGQTSLDATPPTLEEAVNHFSGERGFSEANIKKWIEAGYVSSKNGLLFVPIIGEKNTE